MQQVRDHPGALGVYRGGAGEALADGFSFMAVQDFASLVYKKVVCSKRFKPQYTLGKNVTMLPLLKRLLPAGVHERLFLKTFRVKLNGQ